MDSPKELLDFYRGKKVFITGHTGFKGAYLSKVLMMAGARVTGYSLEPPTEPSLYDLADIGEGMDSIIGDVRDYEKLKKSFDASSPEIVFHLAAQPIVRLSYREPRLTYETNVMGTVNLLECIREGNTVRSFLNVTTDKVYLNNDEDEAFREDMPLDGYDPYSNSKSCSELVTHSYTKSFFADREVGISTARAGNVIGGGDFAQDRLVPDCVRSVKSGQPMVLRNPASIRPFQHVLEPVFIYLQIAKAQYEDKKRQGYYNVGPDIEDCISAGDMTEEFARCWGEGFKREIRPDGGPHEAKFLKLDCTRIKETFNWKSVWNIRKAIEKCVEMSRVYIRGEGLEEILRQHIEEYASDAEKVWR